MVPEIRRFKVNGQDIPAVRVGFEPESEPWLWYRLADGGRIRVHISVVDVVALLGEDGHQLVQDGEPLFGVSLSQSIVILER